MEEMLEIVWNNFSANRVVDAKFTRGTWPAVWIWWVWYPASPVFHCTPMLSHRIRHVDVNRTQSILLYGQAARAISIG